MISSNQALCKTIGKLTLRINALEKEKTSPAYPSNHQFKNQAEIVGTPFLPPEIQNLVNKQKLSFPHGKESWNPSTSQVRKPPVIQEKSKRNGVQQKP